MKRIIAGILFVVFVSLAPMVYGGSKGGYSTGAYSEVGADDTYIDRVSDWFATIGMTQEEKAVIKAQRRAARKIADAQRSIARKKKEIAQQENEP